MTCDDYDCLVNLLINCDFQPGKKRLKDFLFRIFLLFRDVVRTGEKWKFPTRDRMSDSGCQMSVSVTSRTDSYDMESSKEDSNISAVTQFAIGTTGKTNEIFSSSWTVFKMAVNK